MLKWVIMSQNKALYPQVLAPCLLQALGGQGRWCTVVLFWYKKMKLTFNYRFIIECILWPVSYVMFTYSTYHVDYHHTMQSGMVLI